MNVVLFECLFFRNHAHILANIYLAAKFAEKRVTAKDVVNHAQSFCLVNILASGFAAKLVPTVAEFVLQIN